MFKTYEMFGNRDINEVIPEIIYSYLFEGLSLTAIEKKLFRTEDYKGWLSKAFLNYCGIDTEKSNRGLYINRSIKDVAEELSRSSKSEHIKVAKLIKDKYI